MHPHARAPKVLIDVFVPDVPDWIELRKQLSAQVWMPLAEECLKQLGTGAAEFACDLGSVVSRRECLRAAQSILQEAGLTSSKSTRLEKVKIRVSQGDVSSAVRLVLRTHGHERGSCKIFEIQKIQDTKI